MNSTEQVSELVFIHTNNQIVTQNCHYDFCSRDY